MEKATLTSVTYNQTGDRQLIVKSDLRRRYLAFYCVSGTCHIQIDTVHSIFLPAGQLLEPRIGYASNIYLQGDSAVLLVLYEANVPIL